MRVERVYLDYNATAPLLPQARQAMMDALTFPGNPSSVHADGRAVRAAIERGRAQVAALAGAEPAHVTLTSGASEAAATLLTPVYMMGRSVVSMSRLYVADTEHPCVREGGRFEKEAVSRLPVNGDGLLDLDALSGMLGAHDMKQGLPLVAVMLANNESGVVQPIADIAALVHDAGGILVVDAVQAAGRLSVDIGQLGADFLILSSHKIGGPKGAGAIVSRGEMLMPRPLIVGGGQEKGLRAGTENPAAIVGFGVASHIASESGISEMARLSMLRDRLESSIAEFAPDAVIVGARSQRLANTTFVMVPGLKAETAQIAMDLEGVSISAGSACSSGKVGESSVLKAMGLDAAMGALRISMGHATVPGDIDRVLASLARLCARRPATGARPQSPALAPA
jgi:cysteine desulfurase